MGSANATSNEEQNYSSRGEMNPPVAFEGDEPSIIMIAESPQHRVRNLSSSRVVQQQQVSNFWEGFCITNDAAIREQRK